jgi:hypothetical protein
MKPCEAQKICLEELVEMYGGPTYFGLKAGNEPAYKVSQWKMIGRVPLSRVGKVARALGVSTYLLNYSEVKDLNGVAPKWKDVVKEVGFSKFSLEKIFSHKDPK